MFIYALKDFTTYPITNYYLVGKTSMITRGTKGQEKQEEGKEGKEDLYIYIICIYNSRISMNIHLYIERWTDHR